MNPTNSKKAILKKKLSQVGSFIASAPKNAYENLRATIDTARSNMAGNKAFDMANIIKKARAYDNAPNIGPGGPTDAMKMRVAADAIINPIGKKRKPGLNASRLGYGRGPVPAAPLKVRGRPAPAAPSRTGGISAPTPAKPEKFRLKNSF